MWGDKMLNSMIPETPMEKLEAIGFTTSLLENYPYSNAQRKALFELVTKEKLSPQAAISEVDKLTYYMCDALVELYKKDLRGDHLRQWIAPAIGSKKFSQQHVATLEFLIDKQKFTPAEAVKKMNSMNEIEAVAIRFDYLNLPSYIITMNKIMFAKTYLEYRYNFLEIDDFNAWAADCTIQFTDAHKDLLGKMLVLLHIKPKEALRLISSQNITHDQAEELIKFLNPNQTREAAFSTFLRVAQMNELKLKTEQIEAILFENKSFSLYPSVSQF